MVWGRCRRSLQARGRCYGTIPPTSGDLGQRRCPAGAPVARDFAFADKPGHARSRGRLANRWCSVQAGAGEWLLLLTAWSGNLINLPGAGRQWRARPKSEVDRLRTTTARLVDESASTGARRQGKAGNWRLRYENVALRHHSLAFGATTGGEQGEQ